jgi:hypothetical protein
LVPKNIPAGEPVERSNMISQTPHINHMNTPLANGMKLVGMTPVLDSQLNKYVKKKVVTHFNGRTSSADSYPASPLPLN